MVSSGFHALTLVEKTREFDEVYTFKFAPDEPLAFVPGQYVHLLAPSSPPGPENVRHLSIASIPEEGPLWFSVDLGSSTPYKKKLSALTLGGKAHLFKIKGGFVLGDPLPGSAVFLAGGLGITPVRPLIKQIALHHLPVAWTLVHVARGEYLYRADLEPLGGEQYRLRRFDVEAWVRDRAAHRPPERWYVAGSDRFVQGLVTLLGQMGVGDAAILTENFK